MSLCLSLCAYRGSKYININPSMCWPRCKESLLTFRQSVICLTLIQLLRSNFRRLFFPHFFVYFTGTTGYNGSMCIFIFLNFFLFQFHQLFYAVWSDVCNSPHTYLLGHLECFNVHAMSTNIFVIIIIKWGQPECLIFIRMTMMADTAIWI